MKDYLRWLVCLVAGHVLSDWSVTTWVHDSCSGRLEWHYSTNATHEARWCRRCHAAFEQRWANVPEGR